MKTHTNAEIIAKCQSIWDAEQAAHYCMGWESEGCVHVDKNTADEVWITVKCMYEAPPINLNVLMQLAEFFGTRNINDDERFARPGCDTCDYGSTYGFTLIVRPERASFR